MTEQERKEWRIETGTENQREEEQNATLNRRDEARKDADERGKERKDRIKKRVSNQTRSAESRTGDGIGEKRKDGRKAAVVK